MAAPTFVASYTSDYSDATNPELLNITTLAGDVVVVYAVTEDWPIIDISTPTGNSISFNLERSVETSSYTGLYIWSGTDASGGTNWTLSTADTVLNGNIWGVTCLVFRNSSGIGQSNVANVTSGAPSLSLTTVQDSSAIVVANGDWSAQNGSSRTWETVNSITPTSGNGYELTYSFNSGVYAAYGAYYPDAGSAGSKTLGLSVPTGQTYSIAAVEVKGIMTTATVAWIGA